MPNIKYIDYSGAERIVDVPVGWSVMQGAVMQGLPGIDADCGGSCACGTCHVYVDAHWLGKLPPQAGPELEMLELSENLKHNSRLSCQIKVTEALDGLVVTTPESRG
jgi:2Fe-2S ferredoxin